MAITIGKDTYVTPAEADEYIEAHRKESDALRVHWSVLTEQEKELYLCKSCQQLERVMFIGKKYYADQVLAFPRRRNAGGGYIPCNPLYHYLQDEKEVPQEVKAAQIENALGIIRSEYTSFRNDPFLNALGILPDVAQMPAEPVQNCLESDYAATLLNGWTGAGRV